MPIPFLIGAAISALGASAAAAGTIGTVTAAGAAAAGAAAAYKVKKGLDVREDLSQESIGVKSVFTTDEAMKVLGMSKPTILKKMKEGAIPYEGSGGRGGFRIRREALEAYAERNNIVPNWGVESLPAASATDKEAIEEVIKLLQIQKEEAELEVEELELDANDSIEHKRLLIQAKKNVVKFDKDIQAYKMLLFAAEAGSK